MDSSMERNLALEAVRVTEAAALAASRLMGRGDEKAADQAAVNAMRQALNGLAIDGTVVIGEGERDEAPMLYIGEKVGAGGPKLDIALKLEEVALNDEYFKSRRLYPNVDFYSGLIYQSLGFPVEMFTVLFAIPRVSGWLAHWNEMIGQDARIARPRQLYTGPDVRDYVPLDDRAAS